MHNSTLVEAITPSKARSPNFRYLVIKRFLIFFSILLVIVIGISLPVFLQYKDGLQARLLAQEKAPIVSATQMFQKEMYEQLHLLDMLKNSYSLEEFIDEGTPEQLARLEKDFINRRLQTLSATLVC